MDTNLISEQLKNDPRIEEGINLLLKTLEEHKSQLTGIKPASDALKTSYEQSLLECAEARGGSLFYPYLGSGIGNGALVELSDGSVKYDFISGIGPHYWGHSHKDITKACLLAAMSDTVMQGHLQQNIESLNLMQGINKLAQLYGSKLSHCFLSSSGAMANENALKIAFQKNQPADRILCFKKCFSGRTMALAQMTDKAAYRDGLPVAMEVDYIPFYDIHNPVESTLKAVSKLKEHIARFPNKHAAMCFELIQGEAGYYPGSHDFFKSIINVLKDNNIAVWIDEIQTFGRTSKPFAFQHFNLDDDVDIVTIGKLSQVCATLFSEAYKPKPGLLSQTFTSSSSAIASAQLIIDHFLEGSLFGENGTIAEMHNHFVSGLKSIHETYPDHLTGPYGIGSMIAFTVFGGDMNKSLSFTRKLYDAGVISFIAGASPARVRFLMPVAAVSTHDIDTVCKIIKTTLEESIAESEG